MLRKVLPIVVAAAIIGLSLFLATAVWAQPTRPIRGYQNCDPPGPPGGQCPSWPAGCLYGTHSWADEVPGGVCTDHMCEYDLLAECHYGECGAECESDGNCAEGEVCTLPFDCKCVRLASRIGGIAELPEIAGPEAAMSETASTNYALWAGIAAGSAAGVIVLGAGLWYTGRRWIR
jgi:hypothetical protein